MKLSNGINDDLQQQWPDNLSQKRLKIYNENSRKKQKTSIKDLKND